MRQRARVAADGRVAAGVVDCAVVVAVARGHLVHSQRARFVTGDAGGAAQSLNGLKILDEHVDFLHLEGSERQGNGELRLAVRGARRKHKLAWMHLRQQPLGHVGDDDANSKNESLQGNDVKEPVKIAGPVLI